MNRAIKATVTVLLSTALALSVKGQELKINETTGKYHEENVIIVDLAKKDTLFKKQNYYTSILPSRSEWIVGFYQSQDWLYPYLRI